MYKMKNITWEFHFDVKWKGCGKLECKFDYLLWFDDLGVYTYVYTGTLRRFISVDEMFIKVKPNFLSRESTIIDDIERVFVR